VLLGLREDLLNLVRLVGFVEYLLWREYYPWGEISKESFWVCLGGEFRQRRDVIKMNVKMGEVLKRR